MYTRCPSCHATFSITQQHLEIAGGVVRCGMCEHIFDAKHYLFNESVDEDTLTENVDPTSLQANHIDKELEPNEDLTVDLDILDRDLKSNNEYESTNIVDEIQSAAYDIQSEPAADSTSDGSAIPKIIADQVFNLEKQHSRNKLVYWFGVLMIIVLLAAAGLQAIAAYRLNVIPSQLHEPICKWVKCSLEIPRALDRIEVLNRSIFTHPTETQALMVTLTIINRAQFSQPYPIIQLQFLNLSGDVIAARQFSANHYLQEDWDPQAQMASDTPLSIQLEVHDVGEEVVSYNFDFL